MNSEKRFFLAVAISFAILVLYPFYLKRVAPPKPQPPQTVSEATSSSSVASVPTELQASAATVPDETLSEFSNRFFDVEFSNVGAVVTVLRLKEWGDKVQGDAFLVKRGKSHEGAFFTGIVGQGIDFQKAKFTLESVDEARSEVKFVYEELGNWRLVKVFRFETEKPVFYVTIEATNLRNNETAASVEFVNELYVADEHGRERIQTHSFTRFSDKLLSINQDKFVKKPAIWEGQVLWQALTKKYLAIIIKPDVPGVLSKAYTESKHAESIHTALRFEPQSVPANGTLKREFFIYAGPQRHSTLKSFEQGYEEMLSNGFFGIFKLWLLSTLQWSHKVTGNYGWAIIIVTVIVKLLFTPFTHMSFESMKKMQNLQPKIQSLQERYKNDQAKLSQEVMGLYKKHKVNPMSGCLPMVLQIPVFIAFYQVLAETVELKGAPFIFWMRDLSLADRAFALPFSLPLLGDAINILPLLMIGSMVWQQRLTPQTGPAEQQKIMMFMPIVFGFIFYALPSGLVLYWFVNNILSIVHQLFIKGKALPHHEEE